LGITEAERQQLATLYAPGKSLWRTPLTHFTPWDCNWPYGFPGDSQPPQMPPPERAEPVEDPECQGGSIIECQTQTLGEALPIAGTPFSLNYRSDRVAGHSAYRRLRIPVSGDSVPASATSMVVEFTLAGRHFSAVYPPAPHQTHEFLWDGKDAYGRVVQGEVRVQGRTGYIYSMVYQAPAQFERSFARLSGIPMSGERSRGTGTLWQEWQLTLGSMEVPTPELGGWKLSVHHVYEPEKGYLHVGAGSRQHVGTAYRTAWTFFTQASTPMSIAVGPEGNVYITDLFDRVVRVTPSGEYTYITAPWENFLCGWGSIAGLAVAPDGSLYVVDWDCNMVFRVQPDGQTFERVAGALSGGLPGFSGDEGPAVDAKLNRPTGIALGLDGNFYIADRANHRVRRVGPDGIITTVAGTGQAGFSGDGGPARQASLRDPYAVAVGNDGSLYIADNGNYRIRRVSPNGLISTVVGTGNSGDSGDGGPGQMARISKYIYGLAIDAEGNLLLSDFGNWRIRLLDTEGRITAFAGVPLGRTGSEEDGVRATQAEFMQPTGITLGPDGSVYVTEYFNRVRRLQPALPTVGAAGYTVASPDGKELYLFNSQGRHVRTLEALTQTVLYEFSYDTRGRLIEVKDEQGLRAPNKSKV
jgi:streptogramin lyase